ncbi:MULTISPECIES: nuclear transport factor 2 family protein [unclassified Sphingobium]|uniref:nuclear transport factor 2 family protein n=1 Tax=unclassified Sphingobium TaxID=2611147 RepID=UPI0035A69A85
MNQATIHTPAADIITGGIPAEVRQAIIDQIHRYAYFCDTKQYRELPGLFSEDGVFDETCLGFPLIRGRADLQKVFNVPSDKYIYFVHYISNILFKSYDGERATVMSYLRGEGILSSGARPSVLGYYDDLFVRRGDTWLIATRRLVPFAPPSGFTV